jgi:flavorubredoxin
MSAVSSATQRRLPRELASGIFWLGGCLQVNHADQPLHVSHSAYLVCGETCSALVDAGHPQDVDLIEAQLGGLLRNGAPQLRYLFATHTETPHTGAIGRLLGRYPDSIACGEVSDLHLVFPEFADRMRRLRPGDSLDLGGTTLAVLEAVVRDYDHTRWAFDTRRRVLFPGDGFAYSHYHDVDQCAKVAEEVPELDLPDMTALFAELALYWTRFADLEPYVSRLETLLFDELAVDVVAPTHGLPITDPEATFSRVRSGLVRPDDR